MDIGKLRTRQINKDVVHSQSFWQTIICLAIVTWLFAGWALTTAFLLFLLGTNFFWVTLLYFPWYVYDRGQENFGRKNRRLHILRELKIFHSFSKYFPVRLVKTADLPAHRNYIFGYHPHGIGGIGSFCCFLTEGANFKALFPELTPHQLITRVAFWWPGTREFFMGLGGSSATRQNVKSITRTLGNAMIVHVGGAAESLEAHPGSTRFVLKHRKGFIRMALENGCDLVPVYAFGENDIYSQLPAQKPDSMIRKLQKRLQRRIGYAPVFFYGSKFTWLPRQEAVNVVALIRRQGNVLVRDKEPFKNCL